MRGGDETRELFDAFWKQFPVPRQALSQEGGSCVCLDMVKMGPRSHPWSNQSRQSQEHLSTSPTSQWQQVAEFEFRETGCRSPHSVWSSRADREKSV